MDETQMDDSELVALLGAYEAQAIGFEQGDQEIPSAQKQALEYYNGTMDDLPAMEGSSSVVDGTVALVVDNAVSAILKPFVSSDETVVFAPRSEEDIEFAEQATEYVNYIMNCDNPGFMILHNWVKDGCLSKLGVVKVWWEDQTREETQQVQITDEMQAAYIRSQPNYMGEQDGVAFIGSIIQDGRVKIENVPPEEFRIAPESRSIESSEYVAHVPSNATRSMLLEMGFDHETVEALPAYSEIGEGDTLRDARYDDEDGYGENLSRNHKPSDKIALRDEYVRIDYNGDGIAELRRIMRVGDVVLYNEEVKDNPFAAWCPIPMPHKLFGHAIADRAIQEQRIGTAVWRQTLDNLYKSNNPRPVVGEGAFLADGSTEETLMDNAPGAAILVRDASQFTYAAVPFVADKSFAMFELLDKKVEENTGISRAGQGLDANSIKSSGQTTATEMSLIANGKNARTEMVARVFAEMGMTRLFKLILTLITEHQQQERIIRLRNKFVPMDPRGWPEMDVTISVGLGMGDKMEQIAIADGVLQTLSQLIQSPFAGLVDIDKAYNAVKRKLTAAGIKNVDDFLVDPEQVKQQPPQPDPEEQKAQAELQLQQQKMQAEQQMQAAKLQMQQQEAAMKLELQRAQAEAEAQLAREKAALEAQLAMDKMQMEMDLAERRMQMEEQMAERKASMAEKQSEAKMSVNRPGGSLAE